MIQWKAVRDAKSAVATIFSLKKYQNWFLCYSLPCSFKIFINGFAFLYVKTNSKEICEEMSIPPFYRKMLMSALIISKKNACLRRFFFVDCYSPCKDLLFLFSPSLVQKPLYLVGTVLKMWLRRCKNRSEQSCYTQKVLSEKTSSSDVVLALPPYRYYIASSVLLYLRKNATITTRTEANNFPRVFWVSGHTKRRSVNIWDLALAVFTLEDGKLVRRVTRLTSFSS